MAHYGWMFTSAVLALPLIGRPAPETVESYYMLMFSHQRDNNPIAFSHTFATFVKARTDELGQKGRVLESHTISWMPATMDIRLLARSERGVNLDLEASLRFATTVNARISLWGPYRIQQELFDRAVQQTARLRTGAIAYKILDGRLRLRAATNCIHAVSDIDTDNRLLETGTSRGDEASSMVLRHLQRWIIEPNRDHDWLGKSLGLDRYPLVMRRLDSADAPASTDPR